MRSRIETLFSALTFVMRTVNRHFARGVAITLMNGDEPGAGIAARLRVASENGLRPLSGRSTTRLFSMVWLTVELTVSMVAAPEAFYAHGLGRLSDL